MKKLKYLAFLPMLLSAIIFAGCGDDDDDRMEKELNRKIDSLEKEVESLKEKELSNADETPISANAEETSMGANAEETSIQEDGKADTIESLTKEVDEVIGKADSAVPSGNTDEKRTQFFQLKDELDAVDRRLDKFDDYIESLYKSGEIQYDDYRNKERTLEELEDKLDASEDKLEFNFGIDD